MADPVFPTPRKDNAQAPLYKHYANDWEYKQVGGFVVSAVGNGKVRALPVANGFTYVTQKVSAVKDGRPPLMPAPRPDGTFITLDDESTLDMTYLNGSLSLPLPQLVSQNPPLFRFLVGGRYEYVVDGLVGADTGLPGGSYANDFPVQQAAAAAYPGSADPVLALTVDPPTMQAGGYDWPFTTIAACFFDPNLSYRGGPAADG
jgi:hypothetical protein